MSAEKQKFFEQIRTDSNYSRLRDLYALIYKVNFVLFVFMSAISLYGLSSSRLEGTHLAIGIVAVLSFGLFSLLSIYMWYETILVFIDIADSNLHSAYVNHATYLLSSKRTKDA